MSFVHFTNTASLVNSKQWDILLGQIALSIQKGTEPTVVYHLLDRLPDNIRTELHKAFVQNNWAVDEPMKNNYKVKDDVLAPPEYQSIPDDYDSQSSSSFYDFDDVAPDADKRNFSVQFNKINDVFSKFAQNFGASEDITHEEDTIADARLGQDDMPEPEEPIIEVTEIQPKLERDVKREAFMAIKQTLGMR